MPHSPFVETVLGPVSVDRLGIILPHEHFPLTVGVCEELEPPPGYRLTVERMQRDAVREAQAYGVGAFVEVTPIGMRRTIPLMQRVSRDTGIHVITSTGCYLEHTRPEWLRSLGVDDLAALFVKELTEGIPGTNVKAWMIKIAGAPDAFTDEDQRIFRAAALASRATGAAITTHSCGIFRGHFDFLVEAGADPSRIYLGHADFPVDHPDHLYIAQQGGHVIFTGWGISHFVDQDVLARCVTSLIDAGYPQAPLISIDYAIICSANRMDLVSMEHECPHRTPAYLFREALPRLRAHGVDDDTLMRLTVDNPRAMLIRPTSAPPSREADTTRIAVRDDVIVRPFNQETAADTVQVINAYLAGWPYTRQVGEALLAHWRRLGTIVQPESMLLAYRDGEPRAFLHGERQDRQQHIHLLAMMPGAVEDGIRLLDEVERQARAAGVTQLRGTFHRSAIYYGGYLLGREPYHPHWAMEGTEAYVRAGFRPGAAGVLMVRDLAFPVERPTTPDGYTIVEREAPEEFEARTFCYAAQHDGRDVGVCVARLYPSLPAPTGGIVGQIGHVGVQEAHRGKGVARAMVLHCLRQLRAWGASEALIATGLDNTPALNAYERTGFQRRHLLCEWSKELRLA